MQLSLSGFLFEDGYTSMSLDFDEFTNLAREAGYDGIELRTTQVNLDTPDAVVARYRQTAADKGLIVTCLTPRGMPKAGPDRDRFFDDYLDLAGKLECGLLKVVSDAEWLRTAAGRAARRGIALAANTHVGAATETISGALDLVHRVDHPGFGLLYDCLHLCIAGENYVGALPAFRPHLRGVLVQCVRPALAGEAGIVVTWKGTGYVKTCMDDGPVQEWPAVFRELRRVGYDGWVTVIENSWPHNIRADIARRTAARVRELWEHACTR